MRATSTLRYPAARDPASSGAAGRFKWLRLARARALTGSGRPYSVIRAAILRQWALEGRLPSYGQLDATGGFYGGAMAYLAGSAYLEWLAAQRGGDSSLVNLWRRMSARQDRTFPAAFSGVFAVVEALGTAGAAAVVHDPLYSDDELIALGLVPYHLGQWCDGAIVQADHPQYRDLSPSELGGATTIVDGRRIVKPHASLDVITLGGRR